MRLGEWRALLSGVLRIAPEPTTLGPSSTEAGLGVVWAVSRYAVGARGATALCGGGSGSPHGFALATARPAYDDLPTPRGGQYKPSQRCSSQRVRDQTMRSEAAFVHLCGAATIPACTRQDPPPQVQPRRSPGRERRPLHRRAHPPTARSAYTGLLHSPPGRGSVQTGSHPLPATLRRPRALPAPWSDSPRPRPRPRRPGPPRVGAVGSTLNPTGAAQPGVTQPQRSGPLLPDEYEQPEGLDSDMGATWPCAAVRCRQSSRIKSHRHATRRLFNRVVDESIRRHVPVSREANDDVVVDDRWRAVIHNHELRPHPGPS